MSSSQMDWQIPYIHTGTLDQKSLKQLTSQSLVVHLPMKLWGNEGLGSNLNLLKFHFTLRHGDDLECFEHYKPGLACLHLTSWFLFFQLNIKNTFSICAFMDKTCLWWTDRGFCWKLNGGRKGSSFPHSPPVLELRSSALAGPESAMKRPALPTTSLESAHELLRKISWPPAK